jgi:glycosyltransferase involved in cell wall biosynthesis
MKQRILLFADWFEPGYKAGGPIRSCVHFVRQMQADYDIYIFTSDRDLNSPPYENIEFNKWIRYNEGVEIFYCTPDLLSWKNIRAQINYINPGFIYLNSMFSRYFTIYPLLMAKGGGVKATMVLSPRGMLKSSALAFKESKKKIYLNLFRWLGLHRLVRFHATDTTELEDIRNVFGNKVNVELAPNFSGTVSEYPGSIPKAEKELSVIFVGRIHPIKNLDYLLNSLRGVNGAVSLTIVGNEEDEDYLSRCKEIIRSYPANVQVQLAGEIPNHLLPAVIHKHHIFALPTRGENFGHAIFEALVAGKPVLVSDQTPWRNLESAKAGWDISLEEKTRFTEVLQKAISFNQEQYNEWSKAAWQYVKNFSGQTNLIKTYQKLFS